MNTQLACWAALVLCLVASQAAWAQRARPNGGLQRWHSDSELNRRKGCDKPFGQASARDSCRTDYHFDHLTLALMWPPGSCSSSRQKCRRVENRHFTVHGMWPTINGTHEPSCCCYNNVFEPTVLDPVRDALNEYWYSYYTTGDNMRFWSHEWLTHGTCARNVPKLRGEVKYFGTTVRLAEGLDIIGNLAKANIVPDDDALYDSRAIVEALAPATQGRVFQLQCDDDHNLTGMLLCLDQDLNLVDCKPSQKRCQRKLKLRNTIDERRTAFRAWRSMDQWA